MVEAAIVEVAEVVVVAKLYLWLHILHCFRSSRNSCGGCRSRGRRCTRGSSSSGSSTRSGACSWKLCLCIFRHGGPQVVEAAVVEVAEVVVVAKLYL